MRVQLLRFEGCPNVSDARQRLREALEHSGLEPHWEELDLEQHPELQSFGSPTVLIDGRDVCPDASQRSTSTACCRVYLESDIRGVPELARLVEALRNATSKAR
ncbi:MAG: hypothetical protein AB7K71_40170 [Polyangiaceae bacterium]